MAEETVVAKLDVRADASQAQQQLNQLASAIDNVNKRAGATKTAASGMAASKREVASAADTATKSFDAFGGAIGKLGMFAAAAAAIGLLKESVIDFNSTLEQSQVAFSVMTGSADTAAKHIADLKQFALTTPFEFPQLLEASKKLQAMGSSVQDVIPQIEMLGNIASGVGMEKLPQLILAFGQVQAKGKLMGEEVRQFTEAGVPLLQTLARAYGTTTADMQKYIEEGRVGFASLRYALDDLSKTQFADLMVKQSHTFAGAVSNIKDNLGSLGATAFKPLYDQLSQGAQKFADFLNSADVKKAADDVAAALKNPLKALKDIADQGPLTAGAMGLVASAALGLGAAKVVGAVYALATAFAALSVAAAPFILAGAAGVALGVGTYALGKAAADAASKQWEKEHPGQAPGAAFPDLNIPTTGYVPPSRFRGQVPGMSAEEIARADRRDAEARKSAAEGYDEEAKAVDKVNKAIADLVDKKPPPDLLVPPLANAGKAAKEAEKSIEDLLAAYQALANAMPAIEAAVAAGDLAQAARDLVALGKSNEQAVSEVLRIQEEQARKAEQALKDAADRAKEARSAFLDLANVMSNQLQKAFDALAGASQRSAGTILNLINLAAKGMGTAVASALGIPVSATVYTPGGGGGAAGLYAGPGGPNIGGGDQGFGAGLTGIFSRLGIGLGAWKQGAAGEGAAAGITSGFSLAAALGKAGAGLDDISAAIAGARTSIEDLGHWMGENLTGAARDAAGSLIEAYDGLLRLAAEAEGDADKLAKLSQAADILANAQKDLIAATKAAEEAKKADLAAQRAEAVRVGEGITQANQFRLGITTPRGPGGFQGTAPGGRDEYGNFFTPGVQSVWMGKNWEMKFATAEEQYQSWFKARFGLTHSEMELENANWAMLEATARRTQLLNMENEAMVKRTREAQQYQRSMEERIRTAYGITQEQLYGLDAVATGDLRDTLAQLVGIMQRGINAYIEPNHAADRLGAALDQRSALLAGAGGFGPGVF